MAQVEKELEKQLLEDGNSLRSPPSSVTELLALLDRVENSLTRVEQSPSESMKKALAPSMKALIADDLLRHSDVDVKVAVASCISEITRITAPDAPYEDDQMKDVFQLIVSSFEKLDDKTSLSYIKRASILETVAKVRSCVVMLDLECDALILEMFQHFFKAVRDDHPENVLSSMETIMTLVLEESEDISLDLLLSILDILKVENKEVLPIARQLAEKVIEKCASKLKPYVLPALKTRGASLEDYSKFVANVCQVEPEAVEPSNGDTGSKNMADENDVANAPAEKAVEVAIETLDDAPPNDEAGPTSAGSPKSVMSNGTLQKEIEDTLVGDENPKEAEDDTYDRAAEDAEPSKTNVESSGAEEPAKSLSKPEKSNKRKGRTNALKNSLEDAEPSLPDDKKEADKVPELIEKDSREVESTKNEDPVTDTAEPAENEKESDAPAPSPKTSENEPAAVPSPSPSESLADESRLKKGVRGKKNNVSLQESEPTGDVDSRESDAKNTAEGTGASETKLHKRSGKKAAPAPAKEEKISSPVEPSNKEDDDSDELDATLAKNSGRKVEGSSSQREDKRKKGQVKTSAKNNVKASAKDSGKKFLPKSSGKSTQDESDVEKPLKTSKSSGKSTQDESDAEKPLKTSKSSGKSIQDESDEEKPLKTSKSSGKSTQDESDVEKPLKTSAKRKRTPVEKKASKSKSYGPELVGSRIKVWWPDDHRFYKGVVDSYNPEDKKHKIAYDDGDVETLTLKTERWELLGADEEDSSDDESPDVVSIMKGKKAKTSGGRTKSAAKKGGASSSKSKATPKSDRSKQKDNSKVVSKPKEESSKSARKSDEEKGKKLKDLKSGNKSSDDTPKSVGKSKDDDKSKQETPKVTSKSKGKSPKNAGKSSTNGDGKVKAPSSSKDEEDEDVDMSPDPPAKTPETAKGKSPSASKSKSAKKRKR